MKVASLSLLLLGIFLLLLAASLPARLPARAAPPVGDPTPAPGMNSIQDRLAPPPMPANPVQADYGAQVFYQVCMVCHGDHGQGLTDEWRNVLDPEDRNCWQSRCHATNHPPDGFIFPKKVPPVVGPQILAGFPTALSLHDFLKARMPWQAPGTRSEAEYWQLTAFLLRLNDVDPGSQPLDKARAAAIHLNPAQSPSPTVPPVTINGPATGIALWIGFGAIWLLAILGLAVALIKHRR